MSIFTFCRHTFTKEDNWDLAVCFDTSESTGAYTEPAGVAETVSTLLNAKNPLSGRDELLGVCQSIFPLGISLMDDFRF